jgi:hypothetical protein
MSAPPSTFLIRLSSPPSTAVHGEPLPVQPPKSTPRSTDVVLDPSPTSISLPVGFGWAAFSAPWERAPLCFSHWPKGRHGWVMKPGRTGSQRGIGPVAQYLFSFSIRINLNQFKLGFKLQKFIVIQINLIKI